QPEENELAYIPPDEPVSNPQSNPQSLAPNLEPEKIEQEILPAATSPGDHSRQCEAANPGFSRLSSRNVGQAIRLPNRRGPVISSKVRSSSRKLLSVVRAALQVTSHTQAG